MADHLSKHDYLSDFDVTMELDYRLNFQEARACGFVRIFKGDLEKIELDEGEEAYEIYMELLECGLSEEEALKSYEKIIDEVKSGQIEL